MKTQSLKRFVLPLPVSYFAASGANAALIDFTNSGSWPAPTLSVDHGGGLVVTLSPNAGRSVTDNLPYDGGSGAG